MSQLAATLRLRFKAGEADPPVIELGLGVHRLGRDNENHLVIAHPSVSAVHCEIEVTEPRILVRDLGSTNGTLIDGQLVQESELRQGQTLRLGEMEMIIELARTTPRPICRSIPGARQTSAAVPSVGARTTSARNQITSAFLYPFKGDGPFMLVAITASYAFIDAIGGLAFLLAMLLGIYVYAFMQEVVAASARGEDLMPKWPDADFENLIQVALRSVGTILGCFGPAMLFGRFMQSDTAFSEFVEYALWTAGALYFPMAFLAVTLWDSLAALNPLVIIPSILKVPLQYFSACLFAGAVVGLIGLAGTALEPLRVPILTPALARFAGFYSLTVFMRILGHFYYCSQNRLGWGGSTFRSK